MEIFAKYIFVLPPQKITFLRHIVIKMWNRKSWEIHFFQKHLLLRFQCFNESDFLLIFDNLDNELLVSSNPKFKF